MDEPHSHGNIEHEFYWTLCGANSTDRHKSDINFFLAGIRSAIGSHALLVRFALRKFLIKYSVREDLRVSKINDHSMCAGVMLLPQRAM